jgi:hypothetical protein
MKGPKNRNSNNLREIKFPLNFNFNQELTNQYPSIQKYNNLAIPRIENDSKVITTIF